MSATDRAADAKGSGRCAAGLTSWMVAVTVMATVVLAGCGAPRGEPPAPSTAPPVSAPASATVPAQVSAPAAGTSSPAPVPDILAPAGFADLAVVEASILHDIRYHGEHNFVGRRVEGYWEPRCLLTERAAQALRTVQQAALAKGLSLKVYDCYRPLRAGEDFKRWAAQAGETQTKAEFYPGLSKQELFSQGYVSNGRSAHSRGSTVDLTLVALPAATQRPFAAGEPLTACTAPAGQRFPDNSIDMGTGYDCFDSRSHTLDGRITAEARANRLLLRQLMTQAGWRAADNEWWHFRLADEPFPGTYFDFPVTRAALR